MSIKDWPQDERPREKLLAQGPQALSDAELLAIFLRTGCAGLSAVDLARQLLSTFGGLRPLLEASASSFCQGQGLGLAKFTQLQAVLEMSRRHLAAELKRGSVMQSPDNVRAFLTAQLRHLNHEVFAVLFLNSQHQLIAYEQLFTGTIDGAAVYPRELVKRVLHHNASAVILAHNHPSGHTQASAADRAITQKLQAALALLDVPVLDHLIVGEGASLSFAEQGWL